MKRLVELVAAVALIATPAAAAPPSQSADMAAIDRLVRETYEVISGPAGQKRDQDKIRGQFAPGALMHIIGPDGIRGGTIDDYIAKSVPIMEKEGFTEVELGHRVELYGNLASVWSAYDGRNDDGSFHERGINAFQLAKLNGKWLVASLIWQEETPENPLPADLLPKDKKSK